MTDTQPTRRVPGPDPTDDRANLTDFLVTLQNLLVENADIREFLRNLAELTADELNTAENTISCGVTVIRQKRPVAVANSGLLAGKLDEIQNTFGDGPCLTALRTRTRTHVRDVHEEKRWPKYMHAAAAAKVGSILALPMELDGKAEAVVNIYSQTPHGFSDEDIVTAEHVTATGAKALHLALQIARLRDARADLSAALESRTAIDTAVGIIMSQNRCSRGDAFQILVNASSHRGIKLRTLAAAMICQVSGEKNIQTAFED